MAFDDIIRSVLAGGVQPVQAQQRIEGDPSRGVQMIGSKTGNRAQGYYGQLQQPDQQEAVQSFMQLNGMEPTPQNMQIAHDYLMGGQWDRGARGAVTGGQIANEAMAAEGGAPATSPRPQQPTQPEQPGGDGGTPVDDISEEGDDGGGSGVGKAAATGAAVGAGAYAASRYGRGSDQGAQAPRPQQVTPQNPNFGQGGGTGGTNVPAVRGDTVDAEVTGVNPARTDNALGYTPENAPIDDPMSNEVGRDAAPLQIGQEQAPDGAVEYGRGPNNEVVYRVGNGFTARGPDGNWYAEGTVPELNHLLQQATRAGIRGAL